ncbi:MAG TPA: cytochrome c biogenesis protein CcdA [Candidatus Limnocylindria bacterium]
MGELAIAVAAGIGATITPCVLPLYPGFLAYVTAPQHAISTAAGVSVAARPPPALAAVLVWIGVVVGMVGIGAVLAGLSLGLGSVLRVLVPIVDVLLIALGVLLLVGRNPFARMPQLAPAAFGRGGPIAGAFLYGLLFAPIALPCSGPFLIGIFVASLTLGDALRQLSFFAAFGVGFGLPLLALGLVGQVRARELAAAAVRWERPLQLVLGMALIAIGAWDLSDNLPQVIG